MKILRKTGSKNTTLNFNLNLAVLKKGGLTFEAEKPTSVKSKLSESKIINLDFYRTVVKKNPYYLKNLRYIRICDDLLAHENDLPLKLDINFDILELEKQIYGEYDNKVARTYNHISLIYFNLNDNLNAYKFLEHAILIYEKSNSINTDEYKSALGFYSSLCENISDYNKAIRSLQKEIKFNPINNENLLDLYLKSLVSDKTF